MKTFSKNGSNQKTIFIRRKKCFSIWIGIKFLFKKMPEKSFFEHQVLKLLDLSFCDFYVNGIDPNLFVKSCISSESLQTTHS